VLLLYVEGRIDTAIKNLTRLRKDRKMRPYETTLREIDRQLLIIRGKFQEGYTAFRDRSAQLAQKHWDLVLAADRALLPAGLESYYRREIVRSLGDLYYELGEEQFKLGRFREAHAKWSRGLRASPRHDRVLNGVLKLEQQAEKLLREGKQLAAAGNVNDARNKLELARDITAEDRPVHAQALEALKEL
jgi:tetratricopeptide (TPR) repeat protein